jgi:hypothetical protein
MVGEGLGESQPETGGREYSMMTAEWSTRGCSRITYADVIANIAKAQAREPFPGFGLGHMVCGAHQAGSEGSVVSGDVRARHRREGL